MNIGKNIKSLRLKNGLTQEALADRLGITYQAVSKWETDANTPDLAMLPELARIFGTSIDALFNGESENNSKSDFPDDDIIRIVQLRGREVLSVTSDRDRPIEIAFPRNCNNETQYFKVEIYGHVIADGSINGNVICHGYIDCGDICGNVIAQAEIDCGDIAGDVKAEQDVDCKFIAGSVACQGDVDSDTITGSVACSGNINAQTITASEKIKCGGNVICEHIVYQNENE